MKKSIKNHYKFFKKNYNKNFINNKINKFFSGMFEFSQIGNNKIKCSKNFIITYKLKFATVFVIIILLLYISFIPYFNKINLEKKYKKMLYNELVHTYDDSINKVSLDIDINFNEIDIIDDYLIFNNNILFDL